MHDLLGLNTGEFALSKKTRREEWVSQTEKRIFVSTVLLSSTKPASVQCFDHVSGSIQRDSDSTMANQSTEDLTRNFNIH
jgi:hypothetical protein